MSVDGISNTFYPITLSGLTLTDSLNSTYVPYANASTTLNLNQQSLANVKDITVGIPNDNANIYTTFISGGNFNIWTNKGLADEQLMLNLQYIKDSILGRYINYFLYGRLWLYSGNGSTLWMANDSRNAVWMAKFVVNNLRFDMFWSWLRRVSNQVNFCSIYYKRMTF